MWRGSWCWYLIVEIEKVTRVGVTGMGMGNGVIDIK